MSKPKVVSNKPQGTRAFPQFKDPRKAFNIKGRIHGTGRRLTEAQHEEIRAKRKADPKTFTLRRLAASYGIDPGSVFYIIKGGRKAATARKPKRTVRTVAVAARKAKAKPKSKPKAKAPKPPVAPVPDAAPAPVSAS